MILPGRQQISSGNIYLAPILCQGLTRQRSSESSCRRAVCGQRNGSFQQNSVNAVGKSTDGGDGDEGDEVQDARKLTGDTDRGQ